jgi:hypothetical protein
MTAFFHSVGKCSRDRLRSKTYLSSGANIVEQPFMMTPVIPSSPTDLQGLRRFIDFKMSNSEMGGNYKISLDNRAEREPTRAREDVFCKSCSYLDRFNYIFTIYIKMNRIGISSLK